MWLLQTLRMSFTLYFYSRSFSFSSLAFTLYIYSFVLMLGKILRVSTCLRTELGKW